VKLLKTIWYGVPIIVICLLGALTCLLAMVTDWAWLDRVSDRLEAEVRLLCKQGEFSIEE
jgi:hypothetical protein